MTKRDTLLLLADILFFSVLLIHGLFLAATSNSQGRGIGLLLIFAAGSLAQHRDGRKS